MEAADFVTEETAPEDKGYYHEVLEDYDVECSYVEPVEKRRAESSPAHAEALKRLRGPGRPLRQLQPREGPSTTFPPPPPRPAAPT